MAIKSFGLCQHANAFCCTPVMRCHVFQLSDFRRIFLSEGPLIHTCYDLDTRSHKELSFVRLDALWTSVATIAIEIGSGALHDPRKDLGGGPF